METLDFIKKAKDSGRKALTEAESKQVLRYYGIPVVEERVAVSVEAGNRFIMETPVF